MFRESFEPTIDTFITKVFVTFGDGDFRYRRSAKRLATEMSRLELYDLTFALDKRWLKNYYPAIYRSIIENSKQFPFKGFGYWVWKYCALEYLGYLYPNAIIHYADCGHSAENLGETHRALERCFEKCLSFGYLGWELPDCREIEFTKSELCTFLKASVLDTEANQMDASQFFLSAANALYVSKQVLSVFQNHYDLLLDSTTVPQSQFFKQHRHDQSVLSLLWKKGWHLERASTLEKPLDHHRDLSLHPHYRATWFRLFLLVETFFARVEKYLQILVWRLMWRV